jgi:hypothetical protein
MSDDLTPAQRLEVDTAIRDAYMAEDGSTRGHAEAAELFGSFLQDAIQAQRTWPGILLDDWREAGMRKFIHQRWKELDGRFSFTHKGRSRERTVRRGRLVRDGETGREKWVQDALLDFTAADLRRAIAQGQRRIDEERANIATWRALLELLEVTGCTTVRAALDKTGKSLEEYLAGRAA